jgi:hypothetical protein
MASVRRVAKAAAEVVGLVEISEGDANVAALAASMANRDFSPQGEFVLKRERVAASFCQNFRASARCLARAFGDDAVGKRVRLRDGASVALREQLSGSLSSLAVRRPAPGEPRGRSRA